MQIIEDEQNRRGARAAGKQIGNGIKKTKTRKFGVTLRQLRQISSTRRREQFGRDLREFSRYEFRQKQVSGP
jgi:hypothetical protein